MINPEDYYPYCNTQGQRDLVEQIAKHGSPTAAAKAAGKSDGGYRTRWRLIKARAASRGLSPEHDMTHTVPETHIVKGTSTLYDESGNIKSQWVKSSINIDNLKQVVEQLSDAIIEELPPRKRIKPPKTALTNLLTVYPMGDPHIGMYAWHEETGEDFDCEIAERDLCNAIDRLAAASQPTEQAVIINLGDFFHSDNQEGLTKRGGNVLDVDSRQQRVTRIGVRIMTYLIDQALTKHKKVTVINEVGNHDDESSYMLSLILDAYYRNNKRVTIDLSPATFHYFRFGKILIGVTHGHGCKPDMLGQIMAADRPADWGETEHRYWYVGHIHHTTKKEVPGCVIETFRTLAAKDAWHTAKGYRSGRDMVRITHHKDYGETGRETLGIKQIKGAV